MGSLSWVFSSPVVFTLAIVLFLVIILVSIALHEAGHMIAAKKLGMDVPRFFVGFGKTLFSRTYKGTEYGFKAIPLGGFVLIQDKDKMKDDGTQKTQEEISLLSYVSPWKRIVVFAAGPLVNIVLGFIIMVMSLTTMPSMPTPTSTIHRVPTCQEAPTCHAYESGIVAGSKIVAIDGKSTPDFKSIDPYLEGRESVDVTVEKDGNTSTHHVILNESGLIGVFMLNEPKPMSTPQAVDTTVGMFKPFVEGIISIPSKIPGVINSAMTGSERDPEAPGSIVRTGREYGDISISEELTTQRKVFALTFYTGALNLSIGLLNLFPLLPLDGGRIAIALVDWMKMGWARIRKHTYRPLTAKMTERLALLSAIPVLSVFAILMLADIVEIIRDVVGWMARS